MADEVQPFLVFCEDYRIEEGDKPMLLGILSPTIHIDSAEGEDEVYLVTMLYIEHAVESAKLRLSVQVTSAGYEESEERYKRTLTRPEKLPKGEAWGGFLPVTVHIPKWEEGTIVTARLDVNGTKASSTLRAFVRDDGEDAGGGAQKDN